jgi:hypothetical protein
MRWWWGFELVKITYSMEFDHRDCDIAGIAYPVYCFVLPNIIVNFLSKVQLSGTAYIFGLASYGGLLTSSGRYLKKLLKKRGYTLNAGFAIHMPGNATTVYDVLYFHFLCFGTRITSNSLFPNAISIFIAFSFGIVK